MGRPRKEKQVESFVMPTKEEDIKELKRILWEISGYLGSIKEARDNIADRAEDIEVGFKIPKAVAKKMAITWHKQNFDDLDHENTIFGEVYSRLFKESGEEDEIPESSDNGPINSFN
jgi:hypothetical protein